MSVSEMDHYNAHAESDTEDVSTPVSPRKLPDDLPTSLDDRRTFDRYAGETEIYDGWQGKLAHGGGTRNRVTPL